MPRILWHGLFPPMVLTLGLLLIWRSLPLTTLSAALLSLPWLLLMLLWWQRGLRQANTGTDRTIDVVLVGGPAASDLMQGDASREGLHQRWLWLADPEQLAGWQAGHYRVSGLLLVVNADQPLAAATDPALSAWQRAWQHAQQQLGHPLPAALLVIAAFPAQAGSLQPANPAIAPATDYPAAQQAIAQQGRAMETETWHSSVENRQQAVHNSIALQWLLQHTAAQLLPALLPQQSARGGPALHAIGWMCAGELTGDSPWQQAANQASQLRLRAQQPATPPQALPLPEALLASFPARLSCPPSLQGLAWLLTTAALFFTAFATSSAWNNHLLIQQSEARLRAFQILKPTQEPLRGRAAQTLQVWQNHLNSLATDGIPLRLDLGLYQGHALASISNEALRHYQPPAPKREVVRLDTTALFDSGKAVLKPQAKLALQSVLVWLQANPGKRVLIDGHTDNTGNAASNLQLSLARAEAVRSWLVTATTFPITHFAVQGLGDTQPLDSNDDATGRSKNRRVEITLIEPPGKTR
ncbi:OmpA family protein [Aquitalea sp. ASV15]|uniref:OmpA family protein n=1 Tax=Aquitalea sp. ASV15 TaxID=2795104 RepID=UPI0018EBEFEA|nr:OmpA family protein [Aquitalea sp. ASV15]